MYEMQPRIPHYVEKEDQILKAGLPVLGVRKYYIQRKTKAMTYINTMDLSESCDASRQIPLVNASEIMIQ